MRSRDFSVASTMTNPFLVQAAESCAEERAVAVCEAQVDQEAVEVNPFAAQRKGSWWTPFGAISRSKSGNGFVSRRPTEVEVSKAAFDVEEGGSSSDGRCCSISCCASQPQVRFGNLSPLPPKPFSLSPFLSSPLLFSWRTATQDLKLTMHISIACVPARSISPETQICQLCLYSLCATLIIGTGALAYYFVREHHHQ